jgi:hypothetical protein
MKIHAHDYLTLYRNVTFQFHKASQWCTLNRKCARYLSKETFSEFIGTHAPDELCYITYMRKSRLYSKYIIERTNTFTLWFDQRDYVYYLHIIEIWLNKNITWPYNYTYITNEELKYISKLHLFGRKFDKSCNLDYLHTLVYRTKN